MPTSVFFCPVIPASVDHYSTYPPNRMYWPWSTSCRTIHCRAKESNKHSQHSGIHYSCLRNVLCKSSTYLITSKQSFWKACQI